MFAGSWKTGVAMLAPLSDLSQGTQLRCNTPLVFDSDQPGISDEGDKAANISGSDDDELRQ